VEGIASAPEGFVTDWGLCWGVHDFDSAVTPAEGCGHVVLEH
jgi:hypothetical protein